MDSYVKEIKDFKETKEKEYRIISNQSIKEQLYSKLIDKHKESLKAGSDSITKEPKDTKEIKEFFHKKDISKKRDSIFSNESKHGFNSVLFLASEFTADSDSETFIPIKKSSHIKKISYVKRNSVQIQPTTFSSFNNFGVNQGVETFNPESSKLLPNDLEEDDESDSDSDKENEKQDDKIQQILNYNQKSSLHGSRRFSTPVNYIPMFGGNNELKSTIQTGTESLESRETQANTFKFQEIYGSFTGSNALNVDSKKGTHKQSISISCNNPTQTNFIKSNYKQNTPFNLIVNNINSKKTKTCSSNSNVLGNLNLNITNISHNATNSQANHSKNNSLNINHTLSQNSNNLNSYNSPINPQIQRNINCIPSLPLTSKNSTSVVNQNSMHNINASNISNCQSSLNHHTKNYSKNMSSNTNNNMNSNQNSNLFSPVISNNQYNNFNCYNNNISNIPYNQNNQNSFLKQNLASPVKKQTSQTPYNPFQQPITMNTMVYQNLLKNQKKTSVNSTPTQPQAQYKKDKEMNSIMSPGISSPQMADFKIAEDKKSSKKDKNKKNNKQNAREGDWICPECQNLNFSFRIECNKCACQRPSEEEKNH